MDCDQDEEASDKRIRPKEFTDADEIRIVENLIVSDAQSFLFNPDLPFMFDVHQ